jgi:lysozyme
VIRAIPEGSAMTISNSDKLAGIDVSHYQQMIDWYQVGSAGCAFAFIKASEGATVKDDNFLANWTGAMSAGLRRGPYHFFRPQISVTEQIANFLSVVKTLDADDLPPALDLEAPADWTSISQNNRIHLVVSWLNQVQRALKRRPIVYTSPNFFIDVLGNTNELSPYPLWVAHYTSKPAPTVPKAWESWTFWQHSSQGQINGIKGQVDLDWFNGDILGLQKFINESGALGC